MDESPTFKTQELLCEALGVDQKTVSRWVNGVSSVSLERIIEIEDLLGLRRGEILFLAGLVDTDVLLAPHHGSNVRQITPTALRQRSKQARIAAAGLREAASEPRAGKLAPVGKRTVRPPVGDVPEDQS